MLEQVLLEAACEADFIGHSLTRIVSVVLIRLQVKLN